MEKRTSFGVGDTAGPRDIVRQTRELESVRDLPLYSGSGSVPDRLIQRAWHLTFAAVMLIGGVTIALNQTLFNFIISTLMPPQCGTTGVAVAFGFGVAVFGGTYNRSQRLARRGGAQDPLHRIFT